MLHLGENTVYTASVPVPKVQEVVDQIGQGDNRIPVNGGVVALEVVPHVAGDAAGWLVAGNGASRILHPGRHTQVSHLIALLVVVVVCLTDLVRKTT